MTAKPTKKDTVLYHIYIPREWLARADKLAASISGDSVLGCLGMTRPKILRMALAMGLNKLEATPVGPDKESIVKTAEDE